VQALPSLQAVPSAATVQVAVQQAPPSHASLPSRMPLPHVWGSQASPSASPSRFDWLGFGTVTQLSVASGTPSPSVSGKHPGPQPFAASQPARQGASAGQLATHCP
jgi:hypothetical protein